MRNIVLNQSTLQSPKTDAQIARRTFLRRTGVGSIALASLFNPAITRAAENASSRHATPPMHHRPRIKRVIHLCMAGGMSHLESFDEKPKLVAMHGKPMPPSFTSGQPIAQLQGQKLPCLAPQFGFSRHGESGQNISDAFPFLAKVADDLCIIRSIKTEQINHDPAHTFMNTGTATSGRPSMGSWVNYGLGSESEDLPGFVVMTSVGGRNPQPISSRQWSAGFLPSRFQGVEFNSSGDPVHYVRNPRGVSRAEQRELVDTIGQLNRHRNASVANPEIDTRIASYEMAFRMQTSVPELTDISGEPKHVLDMYGPEVTTPGTFAASCLLARRMAERNVRFTQIFIRGWDQHGSLPKDIRNQCRDVDQGSAALIKDLKQRGMLDDTLVVWGGEFGRTPTAQGKNGRDHNPDGFTMWMAGGGVKGGFRYGATDEYGYYAVEDKMDVHDLHATLLYILGLDHKQLTYRYAGRDFRLTDVSGKVAHAILT